VEAPKICWDKPTAESFLSCRPAEGRGFHGTGGKGELFQGAGGTNTTKELISGGIKREYSIKRREMTFLSPEG